MAINAKIDNISYPGIETIKVGGKEIALEESYVGSVAINKNGTHDVGGYKNAVVDVPTTGITPSGTLSITENGTKDVTEYAKVNVNVPSSGGGGITYEDIADGSAYNVTALYLTGTAIDDFSFGHKSIISATGPNITKIGQYALAWTSVGGSVLKSVSFPLCESVDSFAFSWCDRLEDLELPSCERIGNSALQYCRTLTGLDLPACVNIGSSAFLSCSALTEISAPKATNIGASAFSSCKSLVSITLPALANVENSLFSSCSNLKTVDFCADVIEFSGTSVFASCTALDTIIIRASSMAANKYGASLFGSTVSQAKTIYVPAALLDAYTNDEKWAACVQSVGVTFAAIEGSEYDNA